MPIIWVHGVTVRRDRFDDLLTEVRSGFAEHKSQMQVSGFYWGGMGTKSQFAGASIPRRPVGIRAVDPDLDDRRGSSSGAAREIATVLIDDPYLELRTLRDHEEFDPHGAGMFAGPQGVELRNRALNSMKASMVEELAADQDLLVSLANRIERSHIERIVSAAFSDAAQTSRELSLGDLEPLLVRCLTASLYSQAVAFDEYLETPVSWRLCEARVEAALAPRFSGEKGMFADKARAAALPLATSLLKKYRFKIMDAFSLFVGDVFVYLAHREAMLDALRATIDDARKTDEPLWLVGHSLGGLICFEYCLTTPHQEIGRLVTVGSQVGLFGELGAIVGVLDNERSEKRQTPENIRSWTNMYDPNDVLSFAAEPIFTRVTDVSVDTRAPFPASHSEYWNHPEVYARIAKM